MHPARAAGRVSPSSSRKLGGVDRFLQLMVQLDLIRAVYLRAREQAGDGAATRFADEAAALVLSRNAPFAVVAAGLPKASELAEEAARHHAAYAGLAAGLAALRLR
jgi:hypothetical protein